MPKILHFGAPALNLYRNDWNRNNEQLFYRSNSQFIVAPPSNALTKTTMDKQEK